MDEYEVKCLPANRDYQLSKEIFIRNWHISIELRQIKLFSREHTKRDVCKECELPALRLPHLQSILYMLFLKYQCYHSTPMKILQLVLITIYDM